MSDKTYERYRQIVIRWDTYKVGHNDGKGGFVACRDVQEDFPGLTVAKVEAAQAYFRTQKNRANIPNKHTPRRRK